MFDQQSSEILDSTIQLVRKASAFIFDNINKVNSEDIEEKSMNSLVSFVDKEAENILVAGLSKIIPNCGFITEEDTEDDDNKEYVWIIDPLDGTTNFLKKIPHFAVSVALQHNGETVMGIVKEVNSGEEWTAIIGKGAHLNNEPIKVTSSSYKDCIIATGFPYSNEFNYDQQFNVIRHWLTETRGMRRIGSAALDLCYVACGRFGAYHEATLNPWDLAAGELIVREAGGIVTDYNGGSDYLYGKTIIAASNEIYSSVGPIIKKYLAP